MALFDIAYNKYILPNEGGYANVTADKGGETYAGIARNYHPNWPGWQTIDLKKSSGKIRHNAKFPELQPLVDDFYRDWWTQKRFSEINNQDVANILFDFNVNSSSAAIRTVQRLIGVKDDGVMGNQTIAAINNANSAMLYAQLKEARAKWYKYLVSIDPTQAKFFGGWMARLATFPDIPISTGIGVFIGAALLAWYLVTRESGEAQKKSHEVTNVDFLN